MLTYGPNQNLALLDLALTLDTGHWTLDIGRPRHLAIKHVMLTPHLSDHQIR